MRSNEDHQFYCRIAHLKIKKIKSNNYQISNLEYNSNMNRTQVTEKINFLIHINIGLILQFCNKESLKVQIYTLNH